MGEYFLALLLGMFMGIGGFFYLIFFRAPINHPAAFLKRGRRDSTKTLVLCFGDSLTHATISGDYVAMLREQFDAQGYEFVNAGINGNTTHHLLLRLDEIIACKPDIITILIGTNDVNATRSKLAAMQYSLPYVPTLEKYCENLEAIVMRLKAETTARIMVISPPPLGEDLDSEINQRVAQYSAALKDVAAKHGATYLTLFEELAALLEGHQPHSTFTGEGGVILSTAFRYFVGRKSLDELSAENGFRVLTDYIHLNDRGAAVVARVIAEVIA